MESKMEYNKDIDVNFDEISFEKRVSYEKELAKNIGNLNVFIGGKPNINYLVIKDGKEEVYKITEPEIINFTVFAKNHYSGTFVKSLKVKKIDKLPNNVKNILIKYKDTFVVLNMFSYAHFNTNSFTFPIKRNEMNRGIFSVDDFIFVDGKVNLTEMNVITNPNNTIYYGKINLKIKGFDNIKKYDFVYTNNLNIFSCKITSPNKFIYFKLDDRTVMIISMNIKFSKSIETEFNISSRNIRRKISGNIVIIVKR